MLRQFGSETQVAVLIVLNSRQESLLGSETNRDLGVEKGLPQEGAIAVAHLFFSGDRMIFTTDEKLCVVAAFRVNYVCVIFAPLTSFGIHFQAFVPQDTRSSKIGELGPCHSEPVPLGVTV